MSPEEEALRQVIELLDRRGVPYMLTGSVASSYHGRPRATHDADVVIDPLPHQLEAFVTDLEAAGFYVDRAGARTALDERRQFNAIHSLHATKVDLIVRKDRAYSREEFARRRHVDLAYGRPVAIVTAEDAILSKLEWAQQSGDSPRQLRDAAGILELNPAIDLKYVERWANELGVGALWHTIAGRTSS